MVGVLAWVDSPTILSTLHSIVSLPSARAFGRCEAYSGIEKVLHIHFNFRDEGGIVGLWYMYCNSGI